MLILNYDQNSVRTQFKNYFNIKIKESVKDSGVKIVDQINIGKSTRRVVYLDNDDDKENFKNLLIGKPKNVTSEQLNDGNNKIKNK